MRSIRTVTTLALVTAGFLPLAVASLLGTSVTQRELRAHLIKSRSRLVQEVGNQVESLLNNAVQDLDLLRDLPTLATSATSAAEKSSNLHQLLKAGFVSAALLDDKGYVIESTAPVRFIQESTPWFKAALSDGRVLVSPPMRTPGSQQDLHSSVYLPLPNATPDGAALIRADLPMKRVWDVLDHLLIGGDDRLLLIDASQNILYSRDRSQILQKTGIDSLEVSGDDVTVGKWRGKDYVVVSEPVTPGFQLEPNRAWSLVLLQPKEFFFSPVQRSNELMLSVGLATLLLVILISAPLGRALTRPVSSIAGAAAAAAGGDLKVRLPSCSIREIRVLSTAFNDMLEKLQKHQGSLEKLVEDRTAAITVVNSELEQTIAQLRQAQKMEAVGVMAGGIAHDFNNLLTAITGHTKLALSQLDDMGTGPPTTPADIATVRGYLQTARAAADRAAGVVRQLLGFSRKSEITPKECDLNVLMEEVRQILRHTFDARISLVAKYHPLPCGISADANLIGQVLMNLCVNARDAIGSGHGEVRVSTDIVEITESEPAEHGFQLQQPGTYCCLEVTDTGCGIPPENLKRIFEPFFTTKAPNKGSGLGLAMCFGIVQQHGGWIDCDSVPSKGTTFRVCLPYSAPTLAEPIKRAAPAAIQDSKSSGATILLADDEDTVRFVAQRVLQRHGFNVVLVVNGKEAVDTIASRHVDLAILDGAMPVMSGQEAYHILSDQSPALPVIICTGNADAREGFRTAAGREPSAFVQKPYDFEEFITTVKLALSNRDQTLALAN